MSDAFSLPDGRKDFVMCDVMQVPVFSGKISGDLGFAEGVSWRSLRDPLLLYFPCITSRLGYHSLRNQVQRQSQIQRCWGIEYP